MRVVCSICRDQVYAVCVEPLADGRIRCGGCALKSDLPDISVEDARIVALTIPPPMLFLVLWLQETAERN
jgi:hypothetical protein